MTARIAQIARFAWPSASLVLGVFVFFAWTGTASATDVKAVEEDWEMVLTEPDPVAEGPQVTCVMSPVADSNNVYAAFELNHNTQPSFQAGGTQLQLWSGEHVLGTSQSTSHKLLENVGETVRWTTRMIVDNGQLSVSVVNGTSATWGSFGAPGELEVHSATQLVNLNTYSPDVSVSNSGVGFARNRVQSLKIKEVRYYTSAGLDHSDTTEHVVSQLN